MGFWGEKRGFEGEKMKIWGFRVENGDLGFRPGFWGKKWDLGLDFGVKRGDLGIQGWILG